jgi:hypothetical protein
MRKNSLVTAMALVASVTLAACHDTPTGPKQDGETPDFDPSNYQELLASSCTKDTVTFATYLDVVPDANDLARVAKQSNKSPSDVAQAFVVAASKLFDSKMDPVIAKYNVAEEMPATASQAFVDELFAQFPPLFKEIESKTGITVDPDLFEVGLSAEPAKGCNPGVASLNRAVSTHTAFKPGQ